MNLKDLVLDSIKKEEIFTLFFLLIMTYLSPRDR